MIIDAHHHMVPLTLNEADIRFSAEWRYLIYGKGARSLGIDITAEEIKQRLASYAPDPRGEKLMERMAKAGVDVTVICVIDNIDSGSSDERVLSNNRTCADIAAGSRGKIIALAGIDPRRKEAPKLLRRCIEDYGMKGLKWHPNNGYYPNSKEAYAMLAVAEELGLPLLLHTGPSASIPLQPGQPPEQRRVKFAHPIWLDDVAQDFPGVKVIAGHVGRLAWRDWASLAQYRNNLYGDISMWQQFALVTYERFCRDLREMLDIAGSDSILFGSDGPGWTAVVPNEQYIQILRDLPKKAPPGITFTSEEVENILGNNARRVFGLN